MMIIELLLFFRSRKLCKHMLVKVLIYFFSQVVPRASQILFSVGGTSAIFICDDGMQLISKEDREERIAFYANHNIGWVARPGHSSAPGGFKRAGKFKKASKSVRLVGLIYSVLTSFFCSMNYGLGKIFCKCH